MNFLNSYSRRICYVIILFIYLFFPHRLFALFVYSIVLFFHSLRLIFINKRLIRFYIESYTIHVIINH